MLMQICRAAVLVAALVVTVGCAGRGPGERAGSAAARATDLAGDTAARAAETAGDTAVGAGRTADRIVDDVTP